MDVTLVGAGYRPELRELFHPPGTQTACAELIANRYLAPDGFQRAWELEELAGTPILVHGLSGNVASATGPDEEYLGQIRQLVGATEALTYSDHLAFTASHDRALGHLAPNLFDDDLLDHASRHIDSMNRATGCRIALENLATKTTMAGSKYSPEEFYLRLLEKSDGWDCLLDLTNIWINSVNRPVDAVEFVEAIPPERIRYVHLAGGHWIHDELVDSHSQAVHPEAFELLERLLRVATPLAVVVERDANWTDAYEEVRDDVARAADIAGRVRLDQGAPSQRSA
jgi:uncharacterized protein